MAIGRISGPLLSQNLFRDNIPLAFYNTSSSDAPVLYLDVTNGYVGIRTASPAYVLDVNGTVNASQIRTSTATIGNYVISKSFITTTIGPAIIQPAALESIILDGVVTATGQTIIGSHIESTSTNTGSLLVQGGQGIQGNLFIGGITNIKSTATSTGSNSGALVVGGGVGIGGDVNIAGQVHVSNATSATSTTTGAVTIQGGTGIGGDLWVGGVIHGVISTASLSFVTTKADVIKIENSATTGLYYPTLASTSSGYVVLDTSASLSIDLATGLLTTNKLAVNTDVTIGRDLSVNGNVVLGSNTLTNTVEINAQIAGNITPTEDAKYSVGSASNNFTEAFFNNLYSNVLASQQGSITINPADSLLQINANIRVNGDKPIGTAPVVTNLLWVSMDGDDTNDGRAEDASRACRTIGGATRSPYYAPGTSIRVAPGRYLENNPIELLPYTSVIGSDLRTTTVEPVNRTQDLFHVQSGCYLFGMQFLNGRSGRLPGNYANGYNRGAYAMAFPPQVAGQKIDVFHSPYIQNCTNQSGPWLYDGTMFQPNGTVQIPLAAGTSTWTANTSTLVVSVNTGTIVSGMSINAGPQNPGFFNARTLLLANKGFIQEQVVAYVNLTNPGFEYSQAKCFRDVGIIIENVIYDTTFGGNEKSVEAGLAYYNGVTSVIAGQETETINAIRYIEEIAQHVITNTPHVDLLGGSGVYSQVINTALTDGSIASNGITNNLNIIINIIQNGTGYAPTIAKSAGPNSGFVSAEILLHANRTFIQEQTEAWIDETFPTFFYTANSCYRDVGLITDAVSQDLLFGGSSQSTFAGIQYYYQDEGYVGQIQSELAVTTSTFSYIRDLANKIVINASDGARYQSTISQYFNVSAPGTVFQQPTITSLFDKINSILLNGTSGITDEIIPNSLTASTSSAVQNSFDLIQANKDYLKAEAIAYITINYPSFNYDSTKCARDVGYIVDSVCVDLLYGGNRQVIQSGVYYYNYNSTATSISYELTEIKGAYNYLKIILKNIIEATPLPSTYQTATNQVISLTPGTTTQSYVVEQGINNILNIIENGPDSAVKEPIRVTRSTDTDVINAALLIEANRGFLQAEIAAFVNAEYDRFVTARQRSQRDVGLVVDAVSQDIILGGNSKSIEAGLAYWNGGYRQLPEHAEVCIAALTYAKTISRQIIANQTVTKIAGYPENQIINYFFQNGLVADEAVARNFEIITTIIDKGPVFAPPNYQGGGLFAADGLSGDDVKIATKVLSTTDNGNGTITITIDRPTVGFSTNGTLYFGNTAVFPALDSDVPERWAQRRVDPLGAMGGMLVDGGVVSDRSPIASMVLNAYTQVAQGGRGIHIINNGYAQLVSIFTIFCNVSVEVDSGGIASITNSNSNFGDICLVAKGYGEREFSGTVYNPPYPTFLANGQYYPSGYYPQNGFVLVFVPDTANRPHIALVMETEPPLGHINVQGFPGFLTAAPNISTITTGSITISGIDTTDIAIGQTLYIRDQYGRQDDGLGNYYFSDGTVVTDVGYQTITISKAIHQGGGDSTNSNYFTIYACGNAYYTVLSSTVFDNPIPVGNSMIPGIQSNEAIALDFINNLTQVVISNQNPITTYSVEPQHIIPSVTGGAGSISFISDRFDIISNIAANGVQSAPHIVKSATTPSGAGSAISLIKANIEFITQETISYLVSIGQLSGVDKCARDVRLILQQIIYDLEKGGNYYSVYTGLSYWSRAGTYHLVNLENNINDPNLMPDGATVNFYQRSYMSASGYTFEYVGAGMNYGSLPQVGRADPVQSKEVLQLDGGKVFFTSTDQNGDFRIGPGLVISQATGVLSGRTFTKSLFANLTPFILAIEAGG
jgi:hypothetical protein